MREYIVDVWPKDETELTVGLHVKAENPAKAMSKAVEIFAEDYPARWNNRPLVTRICREMPRPKNTCGRITSLDNIWDALQGYRETCLTPGIPEYDEQWDEICTDMAWIAEALGLSEQPDEPQPEFDSTLAMREGWAIFWATGSETGDEFRIEKIDEEGVFEHDRAAWEWVKAKAAEGSAYHQSAIDFIKEHSPREYRQWVGE